MCFIFLKLMEGRLIVLFEDFIKNLYLRVKQLSCLVIKGCIDCLEIYLCIEVIFCVCLIVWVNDFVVIVDDFCFVQDDVVGLNLVINFVYM